MNARPKSIATVAAALLVLIGVKAGSAQEPPDPAIELLEGQVVTFFDALARGEAPKAFSELLLDSPLAKEDQAIQSLVKGVSTLKDQCGEYRQYERLSARLVGTDLAVFRYLYKCENYPVAWYFVFYRPPPRNGVSSESTSRWRVISVRFDTDMELLAR
ncbi:MAG: hypothetical protein KJZ87_12375 [Thermoguttaceae bacterium]|nr:hypothetical protein [Thermoguttaceae bacterium]